MAADCIGIDNLKQMLGTYTDISSFYIYHGGKKTGIPVAICSHKNGNVFDQFEQFLFIQPDENLDKIYTIAVKFMPKAKEIDGVQVTFAQTEKQKVMAVNGPSPIIPQQNMDKYMDLYLEVGFLRAENKRLVNENNDLKAEIAEMESELNEAEINGTNNDPLNAIKEYLPYISAIFGQGKPTNAVNGVDDLELTGIIAELQTIDPEFKDNMFKLLKLAKNKPMIYKMAVGYLNSL